MSILQPPFSSCLEAPKTPPSIDNFCKLFIVVKVLQTSTSYTRYLAKRRATIRLDCGRWNELI